MAIDLKIGEHVSYLRMSNKAIMLTGTVEQFNTDGKTVRIKVDGTPNFVEDAHVDDICSLETPAEDAADLRAEGIQATATDKGIEVAVPAAVPAKSFVTVNGKAI